MRLYKIGFKVSTLASVLLISLVFELLMYKIFRAVAQPQNIQSVEINQLLKQGKKQYNQGEFQLAIQSFEKALIYSRDIKDVSRETEALINLGTVYNIIGNCTKITEYYQQYLIVNQRYDIPSTPELVNEKIYQYTWFNKYKLQNKDTIEKLKIEAKTSLITANRLYQNQQFDSAIKPFQMALSNYSMIHDYQNTVKAIIGLGDSYYYLGKYSDATISLRHALIIAKGIKDEKGEIEIQKRMAAIKEKSDILKMKAEELYHQGVKHYKECQVESAFKLWEQSVAIYNKINQLPVIEIDKFAINVSSEKSEYLFQQGIDLYQKRNYKQSLYLWLKAIEHCQYYRNICRGEQEQTILKKISETYNILGKHQESIAFYKTQVEYYKNQSNFNYISKEEAISLYSLAFAYLQSNKPLDAETFIRKNIQRLEDMRRSGQLIMRREFPDDELVSFFDEDHYPSYLILQKALIAQNKYEVALEVSEQARARIFSDSLMRTLKPESVYDGPVVYAVDSQMQPLLNQLDGPNPKNGEPLADLPSIHQLKAIATEQNATLVEYSIIESNLYIWLIKPTGKIIFRSYDLKKYTDSIDTIINNTRISLGAIDLVTRHRGLVVQNSENASIKNHTQNLQKLHDLLIKPIIDVLPTNSNERVIFIPQGSLFLVPFGALIDEKGKYLIEKHTILTAPSIQALDLTRKQKQHIKIKQNLNNLVVGNPTMPTISLEPFSKPTQLQPLVGAEKEAKAISSILNTQPLIGSAATKNTVVEKMFTSRIIHLATHGLFDNLYGLKSAIALAPFGTDNGLLTAEEILKFKQKLHADLVVLSACDTGRGKITGDGVLGLSRSFISAGATSVIVSLWAVDDGSSEFLMNEFYKNLRQKKLDKATALRKAMLVTKAKEEYKHPLHWAAFTLIGEAE